MLLHTYLLSDSPIVAKNSVDFREIPRIDISRSWKVANFEEIPLIDARRLSRSV